MFRKENTNIFGNQGISKEFLLLEYKEYRNCSKKEFGEELTKPEIYGVMVI
ncbi:hypothetical protein [Oceanirhabdus sp. W0125-5]|uniref:hypothetical protein n=1 Tax=Oceanirhabdus sp. W0125-5 TaxID=2999116 RepID=UPI0022F2F6AE|nr:hypothetical protein [Oceanirhabdus sp. W0125-5]WBW98065.1 hypothetical protein OW730_04685 [Oceanirhabdus sp. W0125-5]